MNDRARALCIGRHPLLGDYLARFFGAMGLEASAVVGLEEGQSAAKERRADVIFCEYDLVAPLTAEGWARVALLSVAPVVVVSMTRDPSEVRLVNLAGISGYVYLPAMTRERLLALLASIRRVAATDALLGREGEYGRLPAQRPPFPNR